jgi:hypothetical protein
MEHWWNDTTGKTDVLGEKHYTASVIGRTNEYGALEE